MDSNQWMTQEMNNGGLRGIAMGEIASSSGGSPGDRKLQLARPHKDKVVNCPRCNSTNTKFCYYNNYSLTQPRYFCKSCRRYWTEGGTLRNVPVGGGSRKHKRSTSLSAATTLTTTPSVSVSASAVMSSTHKMNNIPDLNPPNMNMNFHHHGNTGMDHQGQDLNLGGYHFDQLMKPSSTTTSSALELLRAGALLGSSSSSNDFMNTNAIYANNNGSSSGFSFQELKPGSGGLSFASSVHHANIGGIQENGGRMMFPFGGMMKNMAVPSSTTVITTTAADHNQVNGDDQNNQVSNANGFWNNGGSW